MDVAPRHHHKKHRPGAVFVIGMPVPFCKWSESFRRHRRSQAVDPSPPQVRQVGPDGSILHPCLTFHIRRRCIPLRRLGKSIGSLRPRVALASQRERIARTWRRSFDLALSRCGGSTQSISTVRQASIAAFRTWNMLWTTSLRLPPTSPSGRPAPVPHVEELSTNAPFTRLRVGLPRSRLAPHA